MTMVPISCWFVKIIFWIFPVLCALFIVFGIIKCICKCCCSNEGDYALMATTHDGNCGPMTTTCECDCGPIATIEIKIEPPTEDCPSGLRNRSSDCYMNAMIQAAASSEVLINQLNDQFEELKQINKECHSLKLFLDLLKGVNQSGNSSETKKRNTELLEELIRSIGWNKTSQQDAFDLFSALIKCIHDDLRKSKDDFQMPMKVKLVHRFTGMDVPDKVQDHLGLSIGLCGNYSERPGESLEYLINEHFSPAEIDDDPSKTTQMFFYQQAPEVLLIHIQANKWGQERQEMIKPEYYIRYEECMTLSVNIVTEVNSENNSQENIKYTLTGIVEHTGSISWGHYVAYRKYQDKWFCISDEQVRRCECNSMNVPYILIYEKTLEEESQTDLETIII